jgi:peroxiredoxin
VSALRRLACSFSRAADKFAEEGIKVAAVSVDDREETEALVEKYELSFPGGYGADARVVSAITGAFVNDDPSTSRQPASSSIPKAGS